MVPFVKGSARIVINGLDGDDRLDLSGFVNTHRMEMVLIGLAAATIAYTVGVFVANVVASLAAG